MRAFISINIPYNTLNLNELINLNELTNNVKFKAVEDRNIHISLKFLGEISLKDVKEISDALNFIENEKKFKISLKGIGVFPNEKYVRVLWINVITGNKEICELQKKIDNALRFKFPPEKDFIPHLTIARIKHVHNKEGLKKFIEKYNNFEFGEFTAEKVSLMKSELRKEGPIYTEIKGFLLS